MVRPPMFPDAKPQAPALEDKNRQRTEALFEAASRDRTRAVELKQELDRLGVFKRCENRFLNLFRKAE